MVRRIWALLLALTILALPSVVWAEEEEPEGDAEGYYDEVLDKLTTFTSGDWIYTPMVDGTVAVIRYNGDAKVLDVPATLDGKTVSVVHSFCFAGAIDNEKLTLPDTIVAVYTDAFMYLPATEIVLNEGLRVIGETAFFSCDELKSIIIPNTVEGIGDYAFENCDSLVDITIGTGVKTIGKGAFVYCEALTDLTVPDNVTQIGEEAFPERADFHLYGHAGSAVAKYAAAQGIPFTEVKP